MNVSKSDGTGKLLIHNSSKVDNLGAQFIVNAAVYADNIELAAANAWAGGSYINISIGWNGGGSVEKPIIKVLNEFKIAQGASFTSGAATTYVSFGGISGAGTFQPESCPQCRASPPRGNRAGRLLQPLRPPRVTGA